MAAFRLKSSLSFSGYKRINGDDNDEHHVTSEMLTVLDCSSKFFTPPLRLTLTLLE